MRRGPSKFTIIWSVILLLVISFQLRQLIIQLGYRDLNAFSADALYYVALSSTVLVPLCSYSVWRSRRAVAGGPRSIKLKGRVTHCHKCHVSLEEFTGSNCQFCGWIRCKCGACGCGRARTWR